MSKTIRQKRINRKIKRNDKKKTVKRNTKRQNLKKRKKKILHKSSSSIKSGGGRGMNLDPYGSIYSELGEAEEGSRQSRQSRRRRGSTGNLGPSPSRSTSRRLEAWLKGLFSPRSSNSSTASRRHPRRRNPYHRDPSRRDQDRLGYRRRLWPHDDRLRGHYHDDRPDESRYGPYDVHHRRASFEGRSRGRDSERGHEGPRYYDRGDRPREIHYSKIDFNPEEEEVVDRYTEGWAKRIRRTSPEQRARNEEVRERVRRRNAEIDAELARRRSPPPGWKPRRGRPWRELDRAEKYQIEKEYPEWVGERHSYLDGQDNPLGRKRRRARVDEDESGGLLLDPYQSPPGPYRSGERNRAYRDVPLSDDLDARLHLRQLRPERDYDFLDGVLD